MMIRKRKSAWICYGETYKFYAFTNLDGLVTTDKDEVLNGLKGKSEADMLEFSRYHAGDG